MASVSSRGFSQNHYSGHHYDSDSSLSDSDVGCLHSYRQTARVRVTRTTSKVQHRMEVRAAVADNGDGRHLFGCLRKVTNCSQTMEYQEEMNQASRKVSFTCDRAEPRRVSSEKVAATSSGFYGLGTEARRQLLERTRREVKRLDMLLEQKKRSEQSSLQISSKKRPPSTEVYTFPDAWISDLPLESKESFLVDANSFCRNWCVLDDQTRPPHVDLERFTGEPRDWPEFIQHFKIWIHDAMPNDKLRMIYLEELLSTELRNEYSEFFSSGCYRELLMCLKERYGSDPHLIARSCFAALKQVASVSHPKTVVALSVELRKTIKILQMVGYDAELQASSTLQLTGVVDKLNSEMGEQWIRYTANRPSLLPSPNLYEFAGWLEEKAAETIHIGCLR